MVSVDPHLRRYSSRARAMTASEIRALFAVASRPEVVSLAGGMPDVSILDYDVVADLAAQVMRTIGPTALQYGGGQGTPELRARLVEVMEAEGIRSHPDDLVVTSGGQQGLELLGRLFIDSGDVIIAEGPSYVGALSAFTQYQPSIIHVPMDREGMIPEALEEALDRLAREGRFAKLIYTIPNHQNPAGVSLSSPRRERIMELAQVHDVMVLEDNPYGMLDFKQEIRTPLVALDPERVIYVSTLSKIFAPGMRTGWVMAPRSVRDKLIQMKEASDLCQSNTTQALAEAWLRTQPWREHVKSYTSLYRDRCEAMLDAISAVMPREVQVSPPTGGMFTWLRLPEGLDAGQMLPLAIKARVAYVPGRAFYADGGGSREMRLNFSYATSERIEEGIRRLDGVIRDEMALVAAFR